MMKKGLVGCFDYSDEPMRHALRIHEKEPFNAEPSRTDLISSYITPVELFFKRSHGPIPIVTDIKRSLRKHNVPVTLQCAGNRRAEMNNTKKVLGVAWDVAAVGNAIWGGAKLSDILFMAGIPNNTIANVLGGKHVEFIGVDQCPENAGSYKQSIPLSHATNPAADVLIAYEMNGQVLNRDHGYPLCVIIPGVIGARSVKWLECILVTDQESQANSMQRDYKMFPPSVTSDNVNWSTRTPIMDFPVQCAICSLDSYHAGEITVSGYAVSGGGRGIERVDISIDGGKTWTEARRYQRNDIEYTSGDASCDKWSWVLFQTTVDPPEDSQIIAKAVDSAGNVQPENVDTIWNFRGMLNTAWHRVHVKKAA